MSFSVPSVFSAIDGRSAAWRTGGPWTTGSFQISLGSEWPIEDGRTQRTCGPNLQWKPEPLHNRAAMPQD